MPAHEVAEVETDGEESRSTWASSRPGAGHILTGERPWWPTGSEGIYGLTLSNAMHLSSLDLGKTVELPLDEDLFLDGAA